MAAASNRPHSRLKRSWLRRLRAGAGSLVVAAAVVSAAPVDAATPSQPSVSERVQQAREALSKALPALGSEENAPDQLAWWGNRWGNGGWGWHPGWHNWPNWHNWHNWGNW